MIEVSETALGELEKVVSERPEDPTIRIYVAGFG